MKYDYNKKDNAVIIYPENDYDIFNMGVLSNKVSCYLAFNKDDSEQLKPNKVERMEINIGVLIDKLLLKP